MHTQTIVTTAELTLVVVVIFYEQSRLRHDCVDVCTLVKFPPNDSHGITPHFVRITIRPLTIITFRADILYLLFLLLFLIFVRGSRTNAAVKKTELFQPLRRSIRSQVSKQKHAFVIHYVYTEASVCA